MSAGGVFGRPGTAGSRALLNKGIPAFCPVAFRFGGCPGIQEAAMRPDEVFAGLEVDEEVRKSLIQDIQLRLAPQALKLRCVVCLHFLRVHIRVGLKVLAHSVSEVPQKREIVGFTQ